MRQMKVNRHKMLSVFLALFTVLLLATGFTFAYKNVQIEADGTMLPLKTLHNHPRDVLAQANIELGPQDQYRLSTTAVADGTTIRVHRAVPVTVVRQGQSETISSGQPTVGELAQSLGYKQEEIVTIPPAATAVKAGMQVVIKGRSEQIMEQEIEDAAPVIRQADPTLEKGVERVEEEGKPGRRHVTLKQIYADGEEFGTEVLKETVEEFPQARVLRVGNRETVATSRGDVRFSRVMRMEATAYLPTDGSGEGITASGIRAQHGVVAVDPNVIPLGTRLFIPGYGVALAADTGGAIIGNRIDLCVEDYGEAVQFGRRAIKVYVLE
ncbi:3D domain-containing protein [Azotosporobacter soli]|uniref:3D domain-containing protein n=1 Tax=Azotosporobacter soli TaxID=3055040 RepID=UPI0031FED067